MTCRAFVSILFGGAMLLADVQYDQTSRVTGGSLANMPMLGGKLKEPQTTSRLLKGNRMATVNKDTLTIFDLDNETVTSIDNGKREYSVMTFTEMRQAMDKAMQKMQSATAANKGNAEMTWTVKVEDGSETKNINGFDAKKFVVTVDGVSARDPKTGKIAGMRMVTDHWMAAEVPGQAEMNAFAKRMAEKLGAGVASGMPPMTQAMLGKGWLEAAKEFEKMEGFAVLTAIKMSSTIDGEVMMVPEGQVGMPQVDVGGAAKDAAVDSANNASLGRLGRAGGIGGALGGLGRRRTTSDIPRQVPSTSSGNLVPATMMEMNMEVSSMSRNEVDATKFVVPAGFKQVESELQKLAK